MVDSHVYDVTELLDTTPGAISMLMGAAGTDASALFGEDSTPSGHAVGIQVRVPCARHRARMRRAPRC